MFALTTALTLMMGCAIAPVYQGITAVTIHTQTASGTSRNVLEGKLLNEAVTCLGDTVSAEAGDAPEEELLGTIFILEVKDKLGDRMFELYSARHLKGNKGKFYRNDCIYELLQENKKKRRRR